MDEIIEAPINKLILKLSWPMILAFMLQMSFNIVDGIFVGMISADALAAVSLAFPIIFLMISLASGLGVGTTSLIAQSLGAKYYNKANKVAEHSLLLAVISAFLFATLGLLLGPYLFKAMGAGSLLNLVLDYSNIIFVGSIFMFIAFISNNILRGTGNMKVPMYVMGGSAILNVFLDPLFIFTFGLGIKGAAYATVLSRVVASFGVLLYFYLGKSKLDLSLKDFKFDFNIVKQIFKIGIPASVSQFIMSISLTVLTTIVANFGATGLAAYGIAFRLEGILFMPMIGMMTAIITIVGHNIGAGRIIRARQTTKNASLIAVAYALFIGILFFIFSEQLSFLFNNDPVVIKYASMFLKINAFSYMFLATSIIIGGSFLGAGKPIPPLFINILRLIILAIPLALYLSSIYGVIGVWIAGAISNVVAGITAMVWFKVVDFKEG